MMRSFFLLALLLAVAAAFVPSARPHWGKTTRRFLADDAKPLEIVSEGSDETTTPAATPREKRTMVVKDLNTGEVKEVNFVDPAIRANSDISSVNWLSYLFVGVPTILILDDFLHFLPKEMKIF